MSIRTRLILSNIAMILIPIVSFIVIEITLSILLLGDFDPNQYESNSLKENEAVQSFLIVRTILLLILITVTNGLLTYFVSKSIIKPIRKLKKAAKAISDGDLTFQLDVNTRDELGQLSEAFDTMRKNLKEAKEIQEKYEENRKELIANISHDLKTPITSIKGYVEGIRDGVANTPEKMERYLTTIYNKTKDLDQLIDELFLYSKLDLNKVPYHFDELDLKAFIEDFFEELQFELTGVKITVHVHKDTAFPVMADRGQLKRILLNITQNSIKYIDKPEKYIDVFLKEENESYIVQIQDNGSGIAAENIGHIFEQFYRTDQARSSSTGGTGLGLAIVRQIIEDHGGRVWAESKQHQGTSIYFSLKKVMK